MGAAQDNLIASTNFAPAAPVVSAKMRNMFGRTAGAVDQAFPARIAAGNYQVVIQGEYIRQDLNVTANAANAAGTSRIVSAVFTAPAAGQTIVNLFIRDDAAALTDDALNCEFVVRRLPVVP